jgi:hypothetical protein
MRIKLRILGISLTVACFAVSLHSQEMERKKEVSEPEEQGKISEYNRLKSVYSGMAIRAEVPAAEERQVLLGQCHQAWQDILKIVLPGKNGGMKLSAEQSTQYAFLYKDFFNMHENLRESPLKLGREEDMQSGDISITF